MGILNNGKGSLQDLEKAAFRETSDEKILKGVNIENEAPINITSTAPIEIDNVGAGTPEIYNVTSPGTADTEFSQALTEGTKKIMIRARESGVRIKMAFTSGQSGTNYITIPSNATFTENELTLGSGFTLYMQTNKASEVVEILEWS